MGMSQGGENEAGGLTFRVKERGDAQVPFGHAEGMLQIVPGIGLGQSFEVKQLRPGGREHRDMLTQLIPLTLYLCQQLCHEPVFVDEGVEGQSVLPAGGEVGDIHVRVAMAKTTKGSPSPSVHPWAPRPLTPPPPTLLSSFGTRAAARPWASVSLDPPSSP